MDDVIALIKVETIKDKYGVSRTQETSRQDVFCVRGSISRAEWFDGARNGLNPQIVFTIHSAEYDNESIVEFDGTKYCVYRTYKPDDDHIELYCEYRKGTS